MQDKALVIYRHTGATFRFALGLARIGADMTAGLHQAPSSLYQLRASFGSET